MPQNPKKAVSKFQQRFLKAAKQFEDDGNEQKLRAEIGGMLFENLVASTGMIVLTDDEKKIVDQLGEKLKTELDAVLEADSKAKEILERYAKTRKSEDGDKEHLDKNAELKRLQAIISPTSAYLEDKGNIYGLCDYINKSPRDLGMNAMVRVNQKALADYEDDIPGLKELGKKLERKLFTDKTADEIKALVIDGKKHSMHEVLGVSALWERRDNVIVLQNFKRQADELDGLLVKAIEEMNDLRKSKRSPDPTIYFRIATSIFAAAIGVAIAAIGVGLALGLTGGAAIPLAITAAAVGVGLGFAMNYVSDGIGSKDHFEHMKKQEQLKKVYDKAIGGVVDKLKALERVVDKEYDTAVKVEEQAARDERAAKSADNKYRMARMKAGADIREL